MEKVRSRGYLSPTLVLLAFDWPDGGTRKDFLGFAIRRTPGFDGQAESWLPNRVGFQGPAPDGADLPSNTSPVQKFLWWDARIDDPDRGKTFTYTIAPVVGKAEAPEVLAECAGDLAVTIPHPADAALGVTTHFNRAVVSSQAFAKQFPGKLDEDRLRAALAWLANGLETAIPDFLKGSPAVEGAIYHLTDEEWVIPALRGYDGEASLVYNKTAKDDANADSVAALEGKVEFFARTRAKIMHDKFLVRVKDGEPVALLTGSANFTTEGLATQANVLHAFESPELARLYRDRKTLLAQDLTLGKTAADVTGWSEPVSVGEARVRVFFSPEKRGQRDSIDTIVKAVEGATSSVLFCLFMPTDRQLREAAFAAGDQGKMMFGLINKISEKGGGDEDGGDADEGEEGDKPANASAVAQVEIYHRSRNKKDVYAHSLFPRDGVPEGFWFEASSLPGKGSKFPVYIHHKFLVIDGETDHPTIYTGSANMSKSSLENNDENLLEITGSRNLAAIYMAEFMRLYEHYRARAVWGRANHDTWKTYRLLPDARWARKAYAAGTPEFKSRVNMAGG